MKKKFIFGGIFWLSFYFLWSDVCHVGVNGEYWKYQRR